MSEYYIYIIDIDVIALISVILHFKHLIYIYFLFSWVFTKECRRMVCIASYSEISDMFVYIRCMLNNIKVLRN